MARCGFLKSPVEKGGKHPQLFGLGWKTSLNCWWSSQPFNHSFSMSGSWADYFHHYHLRPDEIAGSLHPRGQRSQVRLFFFWGVKFNTSNMFSFFFFYQEYFFSCFCYWYLDIYWWYVKHGQYWLRSNMNIGVLWCSYKIITNHWFSYKNHW